MSDFTLIHLDDVEDVAAKLGAEGVQARFPNTDLGLQQTGLSLQRFAPGARLPFGHRHAEQEEIYVVLAGGGRAKLEDVIVELRARDAVRVPGATTRGFEAGPEGMELLVFGAPRSPDDRPADDAEVDPGFWAA